MDKLSKHPKCNICAIDNCRKWIPECPNFLPLEPLKITILEGCLMHSQNKISQNLIKVMNHYNLRIINSNQRPYFELVSN